MSTANTGKKRTNDDVASPEDSTQKKHQTCTNDAEVGPLLFDRLVGYSISYDDEEDKSKVSTEGKGCYAAFSQTVMKSGKHFVTFERNDCERNLVHVGIMRPGLKGLREGGYAKSMVDGFSPFFDRYGELLSEDTSRWGGGKVHACGRRLEPGKSMNGVWSDGTASYDTKKDKRVDLPDWGEWASCKKTNVTVGLLLDLDEGTLTLFENGKKKLGVLKTGLTGEYVWCCEIFDIDYGTSVHMKRGVVPTK